MTDFLKKKVGLALPLLQSRIGNKSKI